MIGTRACDFAGCGPRPIQDTRWWKTSDAAAAANSCRASTCDVGGPAGEPVQERGGSPPPTPCTASTLATVELTGWVPMEKISA